MLFTYHSLQWHSLMYLEIFLLHSLAHGALLCLANSFLQLLMLTQMKATCPLDSVVVFVTFSVGCFQIIVDPCPCCSKPLDYRLLLDREAHLHESISNSSSLPK
jgi:hypothetical protein